MEVDKEWNAMSSWGVYDSPWRGGGGVHVGAMLYSGDDVAVERKG